MIAPLAAPTVDMAALDEDEQVKEVYAHYGLAMYEAQVLEHGIVNALMVLEFLPRAKEFKSFDHWSENFDKFMDQDLSRTFGGLVKRISCHEVVRETVLSSLETARDTRNILAHSFFRKNAERFMFVEGRQRMAEFCDAALLQFNATDRLLTEAITPIRRKFGLTDEWVQLREMEAQEELLAEEIRRMGSAGSHD